MTTNGTHCQAPLGTGTPRVVRLLIDDNRVDLNLRNINDRTSLDLAAAKRNFEVIELLKGVAPMSGACSQGGARRIRTAYKYRRLV